MEVGVLDNTVERLFKVFYVVLTLSVERGYPGDSMSCPRERTCWTTHDNRDEAIERLFSEQSSNLNLLASQSLRQSRLIEIEIPASMLADGNPDRWVSDRCENLLGKAGWNPGNLARMLAQDKLSSFLLFQLGLAVVSLEEAVKSGASETLGGTPALALEMSACGRRAYSNGIIDDTILQSVVEVANKVGNAAWQGQDTLVFLDEISFVNKGILELYKTKNK